MLRIVADNFVKPECRETFLSLAEKLVEETRKEEGNVLYHLHKDVKDENHMTFIEEWKDQEAIDLHNASAHFTTLVPKMAECAEKPGTCYVYEVIQ